MIRRLISIIGRFISLFVTPRFLRALWLFSSIISTEIHKRFFKESGANLLIKQNSFILGHKYISLGNNVSFGKDCALTAWDTHNNSNYSPLITIGDNCSFGDRIHITAINEIKIGNGVLTGRDVTITDNSHGEVNRMEMQIEPLKRTLYSKGGVWIKDNVWIGDKVTILPNVTIGFSCVIGSNSVVTKSFPDKVVIAGNPAKIIKQV